MKSNLKEDLPLDVSSFISHLPIAVFVADDRGRIIHSNQSWLNATGYSEGEIQSIEQMDTLENHLSHKVTPLLEKLFSNKRPETTDISVVHKTDQKITHFKLSASLFQNQYACFSGIDITDQVKLQGVLQDKKKQFFSIINTLGDVVFKVGNEGDILNMWTNNLADYFPGTSSYHGTNLSDYFTHGVVNSLSNTMREAILKRHPVDMEFPYRCEGKDRWYLAKVTPIQIKRPGPIEETIVIIREITEEKKIRDQIEYKNKLINQLTSINNGPLLHVVEGDGFEYNFISGDLSSLTGYSSDKFSDLSWTDVIHKHDRNYVLRKLQELKTNPKVLQMDLVYKINDNNGNDKWIANYIFIMNVFSVVYLLDLPDVTLRLQFSGLLQISF